jgi:malate dehydrogenase (oxaloacetate-decarboxylating)(NADP+)
LRRYREIATCFNDDIEGTAAVVLGGLIASLALTGHRSLEAHTFLFFGAGEAAVGIAELISLAITREGERVGQGERISIEAARRRCWLFDRHGLVTESREAPLETHKRLYAHHFVNSSHPTTLRDAIQAVKPTVLIGVAGVPGGGAFDENVVHLMSQLNDRPVIFALSNPTDRAECSAEQAYQWSAGKAVFASGSPFDPVTLNNPPITLVPGQGNNSYIFPGMALAILLSNALHLTDEDFLIAAHALAKTVPSYRLDQGSCYPSMSEIRDVSACIAIEVAKNIYETGRSTNITITNDEETRGEIDWRKRCQEFMYVPRYEDVQL